MKKQNQKLNIWKVAAGILFLICLGLIAIIATNEMLEKQYDGELKTELIKFSEVAKPGQQLTACRPEKNICYSLRVPVGVGE